MNTAYSYDDADRLTSVKDAANNTTTYASDTENNLTSIADANGHTTFFSYDAFGKQTSSAGSVVRQNAILTRIKQSQSNKKRVIEGFRLEGEES